MRIQLLQSDTNFELLQTATKHSMQILEELHAATQIGVTAAEINELAGKLCKKHKVKPAFVGQQSGKHIFDYNLCISVNDAVLHGVPGDIVFREGDIVKLDFGIEYKGIFTDHCVTIGLGQLTPKQKSLIQITKLAVEAGVAQARNHHTAGDIGFTMQTLVEQAGFNVLKEFIGHGIGHSLHEAPEIPAYGVPGSGQRLQIGDVICVEAQVVAGKDDVYIDQVDGWTVYTDDGEPGAMFEYMVMVTEGDPIILTDTRNWKIYK